jgi:hypothetical protein
MFEQVKNGRMKENEPVRREREGQYIDIGIRWKIDYTPSALQPRLEDRDGRNRP